jgi:hypothetical protein
MLTAGSTPAQRVMLKGTKKTVIEVDYHDVDQVITKEYGRDYECVAYEEWGNYQDHSLNIKKEPLDEFELEDLERWKSGDKKARCSVYVFLTDLCNQGKIEEGEYLINVFW